MTPRVTLATVAKAINEKCPGFDAKIVQGYCNTDRKVGRLRIPGKGRKGNRLIVTGPEGRIVIDHNAAETYRHNSQVLRIVEGIWGRIWEPGVKAKRVKQGSVERYSPFY